MQPVHPKDLLRRACAAALANDPEPTFLGSIVIDDVDRQISSLMAECRRRVNEEPLDDWGRREGRHRGDEATQQKTFADGSLGEVVISRRLRSLGQRGLRLSSPVEWVPSTDPDLIYRGKAHVLRADIKAANYKRPDGTSSWTINERVHQHSAVDGYLAADLSDEHQAHVWYYIKAAVEATGDLLTRKGKGGQDSRFYRLFFPRRPLANSPT